MNYLPPVCTQVDMCAEGVLCFSESEFTGASTEKFDSINDFEW